MNIGRKLALIGKGDILSFLLFPVFLPYAWFLMLRARITGRRIWLICERKAEARDNGFVFFKYCIEYGDSDIDYYYAIDPGSLDAEKVREVFWRNHRKREQIDRKFRRAIIRFGSIRHWAYWLACDANISSQKNSGPNNLAGYIFRKSERMNRKMIFLQHGTILNDLPFLHYKSTKFRLMLCSAVPEYAFVSKTFGYPKENLALIGGQCRFDLLPKPAEEMETTKKKTLKVLIMPTWRDWLFPADPRMKEIEGTTEFTETGYFKAWQRFLSNPALAEMAEQYDVQFIFYPHPSMQGYAGLFGPDGNKNAAGCGENAEDKGTDKKKDFLTFADDKHRDLQALVRQADLLVTDYSSIFFDFVYMGKSVVFYQFDEQVFRRYQYPEGYFSYRENAFGKWCDTEESCMTAIGTALANNCSVDEVFLAEREKYFPEMDGTACGRAYQAIRAVVD